MSSQLSDHLLLRRRPKEHERNLPAALLSVVVIATLATALVHPRWFHLRGGGCTRKYIGVHEFFYIGYFEKTSHVFSDGAMEFPSYTYYGLDEELKDCVTPMIVCLQRIVIVLCFLAILSSLLQFFMDALGVTRRFLGPMRQNAVCSVLTVIFCVALLGDCYYISVLMEEQQEATRPIHTSQVEVSFSTSYHLATAAGAIAVLAASTNLLRVPSASMTVSEPLLDDGSDEFSVGISHSEVWSHQQGLTCLQNMPPLPPYTP
ncbi:transmembrane protein 127-like [Ornithodoros turicata]